MGFPEGKLKDLLIACARAVEDDKDRDGIDVMVVELRRMVCKSGDPFERLGAYMLEALVARMDSSGLSVYKDLKAEEAAKPSDLMSYMQCEVCPQFKFAGMSANGAIAEAVKGQATIHIIDFNISDGSQWITLLQALGARPGGAPSLRITGISDTVAARSRNSKLELTERRLSYVAERLNVPFEFHAVAISGDQVEEGHLAVIPRPGGSGEQEEKETVVVNFPMELDKISNRDRIFKLVKSLSPRVLTLVEPECNTNSANFFHRFVETLDYHAAVFESMDVAFSRKGETRMNMEQHFLWRQIVNIVACEGSDRVERHEHFVQWKARLLMAGFTPHPLSSITNKTIRTLLQSYHSCYRVEERDEVLYLGWKDRVMVVTSAWH